MRLVERNHDEGKIIGGFDALEGALNVQLRWDLPTFSFQFYVWVRVNRVAWELSWVCAGSTGGRALGTAKTRRISLSSFHMSSLTNTLA